jgi:hypothetical protein
MHKRKERKEHILVDHPYSIYRRIKLMDITSPLPPHLLNPLINMSLAARSMNTPVHFPLSESFKV